MDSKRIPELDKLFSDTVSYRKSERFDELLKFIKRFPNLAPYNAMLLHIQRPGSQYVASASQWEKQFNRTIKANASPLVILRPFGPVSFVFEVSDTEGGEEIPDKLLNPFDAKGDVPECTFKSFIDNLKCKGISYTEDKYGTNFAGLVQLKYGTMAIPVIRKGKNVYVRVIYDIVVNQNNSRTTKFATILHELAHVYCGHLGFPYIDGKLNKYHREWEDRRSIGKIEKEFEAESVCWLICERMGIENPSDEYLSGYLKHNNEIPRISVDAVLKAVGKIESIIKGDRAIWKELIVT